MPHISSFIDRPTVLGRGAIGSSNLADLSVSRNKIARSAVGSGQHGTLNLAKAVGTLSTVDIGSALFSYGSAGTFAARIYRGQYGSFGGAGGGTVSSQFIRAGRMAAKFGSFAGTMYARYVRGLHGSFSGTLAATVRGEQGSFGTVSANIVRSMVGSFVGTVSTHRIVSNFGSFRGTVSGHRFVGSLGSFTRLPVQIGSFGSLMTGFMRARFGSFYGTVLAPFFRGRAGTFMGTMYARVMVPTRLYGSIGSFARVRAGRRLDGSIGSFGRSIGIAGSFSGTVSTSLIRGPYGSFGTVNTRRLRGAGGGLIVASRLTPDISTRVLGSNTSAILPWHKTYANYSRVGSQGSFGGTLSVGGVTRGVRFLGSVGSFARTVVGAANSGSFGTLAAGLVRGRGSFGPPFIVHLGTTGRSTLQTGSPIPPPPRWRNINWFFRLNPSVANDSAIAVTQARGPMGGTLGRIRIASGISSAVDEDVSAWVSPYQGSYRFRNFGAAAGSFLGGVEWTH